MATRVISVNFAYAGGICELHAPFAGARAQSSVAKAMNSSHIGASSRRVESVK